MNPESWGWVLKEDNLEPIQTLLGPAPEKLLNTIFCDCKKGCNNKCSCKKVGLYCSQICSYCQGQSCSNVKPHMIDEDVPDLLNHDSNIEIMTQEEEICVDDA